ncbi:MAG: prepilin-type N-terminal cleavage/methylation domain-containing protein [Candidatus Pacebacteria bacterium]|nr:prepilin-type N-terminal cleavage/methylation domain-containing protein [Candidatus Paceibacterota bacterium]
MPKLRASAGFSLLELLVVIFIIGILVTLGSAAYITAQKKARDATRQSDLKALQDAQEQYYAANGEYFDHGGGDSECSGDITGILEPIPQDPKSPNSIYECRYWNTGESYCVAAELEASTGNCGGCSSCANKDPCLPDAGDTHFCVHNLQ